MRAYVRGERCLMELLQESLDDPAAEPCGRCSVCRGGLPRRARGRGRRPETRRARSPRLLRGQVHLLEPRKMWPGGAFGVPRPDPGRARRTTSAAPWSSPTPRSGARPSRRCSPGTPRRRRTCSTPASGCCASGARRGAARPEVVVDLTADGLAAADRRRSPTTSPRSVGSTGRRWPGPSAPPDLRELSSSDEAAFWRDHLDASGAAGAVAGRAVLLVVDASSSLWPVTVASAVLRRAGAAAVLPLLLHRRP